MLSTWHGIPAKACQVAPLAVHLARNPRESVSGVLSCRPPGTEFLRKCSRCHFLPSTWHGIPAKVFQVSLPAVHLARNSCESVSGSTSCCPPGTESPRKRVRCPFLPSTWHGIPAKVFQVSLPAVHLARNSCESVPGVTSCRPPGTESLQKRSRCLSPPSTWHGIPAKVYQVSLLAVHLPRFSCESVPSVSSRRPPATVFPQKRSRCLFSAFHLARYSRESVSGVLFCRPPGTESPQKRSRWETSFGGFVHYVMSGLFSRTN